MPRKMLMIDDDRDLTDVVGKYMKLQGWEFNGERMPDGAVEKAKRLTPDVILLDVELPGASGWDVCKELKKSSVAHIPVIMVSGARMNPEDKALGLENGADDYLSKPFDLDVLTAKIDAILRTTER